MTETLLDEVLRLGPYLFYNFYLATYLAFLYVPLFPFAFWSAIENPTAWRPDLLDDHLLGYAFESNMLEQTSDLLL